MNVCIYQWVSKKMHAFICVCFMKNMYICVPDVPFPKIIRLLNLSKHFDLLDIKKIRLLWKNDINNRFIIDILYYAEYFSPSWF